MDFGLSARDQVNCPQYRGVRIKEVSVKADLDGTTFGYDCRKILGHFCDVRTRQS